MKILYFDLDFPYLIKNDGTPTGGAAVEWESWFKGFSENNHDIILLTWAGAKKFIGKTDYNIIEGIDLKGGIKVIKWFTHRFLRLYTAISNAKPNIVVKECADAYTGILAIISKILKIKFLYRVANDLDSDERYKNKLSYFDRKLFELGLRLSDYILCQNQYQYENFKKKFPNKKILVLYNPIEISKNKYGRSSNEKKYVAWIGIFQYQKNLPALFEIAKSLPTIKFKLAGKEDSGIDKQSKEALEKLKKLENVELVGFIKRDMIEEFLSSAYCLLNTSHFEGFSNTFLEAWSIGTPVITSENVNPDNLITENDLGLVGKNYSDIPIILNKYINQKEYDSLGINCFEYVKEKHNPRYLAKEFINFISN